MALSTAGLVTLVAAGIVVENIRGDRAWARIERELHARGERLTPPPAPAAVPDEQNLLQSPLLARLAYKKSGDDLRAALLTRTRLTAFRALGGFRGPARDFPALRDRLQKEGLLTEPFSAQPAADVCAAMASLDPLIDDVVDAARTRPRVAWDASISLPEIAVDDLYLLAQALAVRAAAKVDLNRADEAFADLVGLQRLAGAFATPPFHLLSALVGVAMQGLAADAIAEGCRRHIWSDTQLARFQQLLDASRPMNTLQQALRGERAHFLAMMDLRPSLPRQSPGWPRWFFHGWAQQNKVSFCERFERDVLSLFGAEEDGLRVIPSDVTRPTQPTPSPLRSPYTYFTDLSLNNLNAIVANFGASVERLRLASITWALERHRLTRGRFPARLEELTPAFLSHIPRGVFGGQSVHFAALPDGTLQLYGYGQNGRDDGGRGDDVVAEVPPAA